GTGHSATLWRIARVIYRTDDILWLTMLCAQLHTPPGRDPLPQAVTGRDVRRPRAAGHVVESARGKGDRWRCDRRTSATRSLWTPRTRGTLSAPCAFLGTTLNCRGCLRARSSGG